MDFYARFHNFSRKRVWAGLLLSLFMAACSQEDNTRTAEILRVAVVPDQSEIQLHSKYKPLFEHIKSRTDLDFTLKIPESYAQLLEWFEDKQVDIARFGGATYVKAHLQSKAAPLVMRDVDGHFRSVALVRANNPAKSIMELEGAALAFGDALSTSGHYMPRYFFKQQNIDAETFFGKILYSGSHSLTAEWVRDGKVACGVANSGIVNEMFLDGRLSHENIKIIWESPPYADYVWAVQPDISDQQRTLIRDAFMQLNQDPKGRLVLVYLGANYYIPASHDDFSGLEQAILEMDWKESVQ